MRNAFYYDSAIPPENWLKITSLLWNKIYISPLILNLLKIGNHSQEVRDEFLTKLYYADNDLFNTFSPEANWKKAQGTLNEEYFDIYRKLTDEFIRGMESDFDLIDRMKNLIEEMGCLKNEKEFIGALKAGNRLKAAFDEYKTKTIEKANYFNFGFYNHRFKELFPQLDYFFNKEKSFHEYCSSEKEVILLGVEALLPLNIAEISIPQIKDFRELTKSQRLKFIRVSEGILKDIMNSYDEEGFNKALRRFREILDEKILLLQKDYKLCKIQVGMRKIKIICLVTTGLHLLFPISIYEPALWLSDVSVFTAEHFLEKRKGEINIDKESWGILMPLAKIKK